ncbi:FecR/PupR family sigma factor regulator [Eleftheria terrae]|uniref:FecR/PupR family sigma factor regulator n=1 Tax=Eleftheria terrae TaxID=1597781 RepID=UPI00263AB828|nr:DUF4880 domain-containing protein [Eleftheria terrae]WKB55462.1 DUF4880 domain-containing protein [Eleftheria terrae]
MSTEEQDDPRWDAAWSWVMREHEHALGDAERAELQAWLQADPANRKTYDAAARLWLLSGLVPLAHAEAAPPAGDDEPQGGNDEDGDDNLSST